MLYYKATLLKQMAKNCDILEFVIRVEGEGSFIEKEVYERGGNWNGYSIYPMIL